MNKQSSVKMARRLYTMLAVSVVLALVVVGMLVHIRGLSSRIESLENQASSTTKQLSSFKRSLCSSEQEVPLVGQRASYSIESAGYTRSYQVHAPDNYDPSVRYPVILSFDGIEGSGSRMEAYSGLDALPAILVYPDSLPGKRGFTSWEGAPYSADGTRDVQFVDALLKQLPSQYCVDSTRIFATGMSNGGAFATIVGCELGNQIRAVASVSGAYYTTCQQEERTPSLLVLHSTTDKQVPFTGATARHLPGIPKWAAEQGVERGCKTTDPAVTVDAVTYYNWLGCADNSTVRLVVVHGQPHGWLTTPQMPVQSGQGVAGYIWKFFEASIYK